MGSFPFSLVPISTVGVQAQCAWAPEPVFTLEESARLLGITENGIRLARKRYPQIQIPLKVGDSMRNIFGSSLTDYGEVRLVLDGPGGRRERICITHYGLFRHAVYTKTEQSRRYALHYPEFIQALATGDTRAPVKIAARYRYILDAPRGRCAARVREVCSELGKSKNTILRHINRIAHGQVTLEGLPILRKPGPPKGYGSKVTNWMEERILDEWRKTQNKKSCYRALMAEFARRGDPSPRPSYWGVQRLLWRSGIPGVVRRRPNPKIQAADFPTGQVTN